MSDESIDVNASLSIFGRTYVPEEKFLQAIRALLTLADSDNKLTSSMMRSYAKSTYERLTHDRT